MRAAWVAAALASVLAAPAYSQGTGQGPAAQPPAQGYGPGMMRGYGPGPGAGRGYGYEPGMMGGYGRGMGYGPGWGRGYASPLDALELTDEQREKILALQEQNRQKNWDAVGKLRAEAFKLRGLYHADKLDANAVVEQQRRIDELRRQVLRSRIETHKQVEALLTPAQREQFRRFAPWWLEEADED